MYGTSLLTKYPFSKGLERCAAPSRGNWHTHNAGRQLETDHHQDRQAKGRHDDLVKYPRNTIPLFKSRAISKY